MNLSGLSLDHIPPLRTPLGFFLLAPLFGVLAGLVLVVDPSALAHRWQPGLLAFTHLLTLGFGAQVMVGALFQVLPVVSNRAVAAGPQIAPWVRSGLAIGALLLAGGFLTGRPLLFGSGAAVLGLSFTLFGTALAMGIGRARPLGDSTRGLGLALAALAVTLLLGLAQSSLHFWPEVGLYRPAHTDLHAIWGGLGWSLLLIMAVSFQVIPMFHVAPAFPGWLTRWLPPLVLVTLLGILFARGALDTGLKAALCLQALTFAVVALRTLGGRKRKLVDYTVRFWQLGLTHLALGTLLGLVALATPTGTVDALWLGSVLGLGFVAAVMLGMLQKILPFLIYLHLQRAWMQNPMAAVTLPNMKTLIPADRSRRQWQLHLLALATFYAALLWPPLAPLAGGVLAADFAWLARCLIGAAQQYRLTRTALAAG